jgi:hypothetical protein
MELEDMKETLQNSHWFAKALVLFFVLAFVGTIAFRIVFVDFVDNYEIGYRYDTWGPNAGKIQVLPRTGYFVTGPFKTKIHTIDGRPVQVCISAINRTLNCKLVQFNPAGIDLFLQWHGRGDYRHDTASSSGTSEDSSKFDQILKNYAYDGSGTSYPFLTIKAELTQNNGPDSRSNALPTGPPASTTPVGTK